MLNRGIIIAIDGPAASGKSTTAKKLAEKLGVLYVDTGAMYRAATYHILNQNINPDDENKVVEEIKKVEIRQENKNGKTITYLNNKDISDEIRNREVTLHINSIASNQKIRELLVLQQQFMGENGHIVMDGRDIGTVVFPHADYKFFMVAGVEERAKRRLLEFKAKGEHISLEQVIEEIKARDLQDEIREFGALKMAEDAIKIDTSKMTIDEQVDFIIKLIKIKK